ncbi:MAG: hypothetical protein ACYC0E_14235, partial [Acidimicrobiales bacterium]
VDVRDRPDLGRHRWRHSDGLVAGWYGLVAGWYGLVAGWYGLVNRTAGAARSPSARPLGPHRPGVAG